MIFQKADIGEFDLIKEFYWDLIDEMKEQNDKIGWKKGIYPTDDLFIIIWMSKIYFDLHRLRLHLKQKKCNQNLGLHKKSRKPDKSELPVHKNNAEDGT